MTWRISLAAALTATLVAGSPALAQPPVQQPSPSQPPPVSVTPPPPSGTSVDEVVNLSVEVAISRHRGDELVSRRPYVLSFTSGTNVTSSVSLDATVGDGGPLERYRHVGTRIESFARGVGDDRYEVTVRIEESSIHGEDEMSMEAIRVPGMPVSRSFESQNMLVLRDGQSHRYTAAADRVTGETIRVDVTLTVLDQESAP